MRCCFATHPLSGQARSWLFTLCFAFCGAVCALSSVVSANDLNRDSDPVVMQGSDFNRLVGVDPDRIVAFKYESGWVQIPVQVDERAVKDFGVVYCSNPTGLTTLAYADAATFMGADPDAGFDSDDELVFMAKDAGEQLLSQVMDPAGVLPGSRVEVALTDPISASIAYVYLFVSDGNLSPGAGIDYVDYDFVLLSGPYLTTYNTQTGPNPENSVVVTPNYREHFSDRWIHDQTNIYAGGASGADILDRHKNLFAPGNCARSENTFSAGEGAFFANIDGPVRAIRSYMGANSGPLTQRDHFFYEKRHDIRTYLRVHPISGIMDFYDYSPAATGMVYYHNLHLGGATIDGSPSEVVAQGPIAWEMVTGSQGSLVHASFVDTDIPGFVHTSYYYDDSTPSVTQCTGDADAYGSSGLWVQSAIPNTDPAVGAYYLFVERRTVFFEPPNQTVALAQARYNQASHPLIATVSPPTMVEKQTSPPRCFLAQNVPNPFTGETRVRFEVPSGRRFALRVYDVRGRLVRTMLEGVSTGDGGTAVWDGSGSESKRLPSGIYFLRLEGGRTSDVRKMVLLD